jgi:hypothetical protein
VATDLIIAHDPLDDAVAAGRDVGDIDVVDDRFDADVAGHIDPCDIDALLRDRYDGAVADLGEVDIIDADVATDPDADAAGDLDPADVAVHELVGVNVSAGDPVRRPGQLAAGVR